MVESVSEAIATLYQRWSAFRLGTTAAPSRFSATLERPRNQTRTVTTISDLPTEVVNQILAFCGNVEVACLCLTSRYLYNVASRTILRRSFNGDNFDAIGQHLEPHAPGYSYCANRRRLIASSSRYLDEQFFAYHECSLQTVYTALPPATFAVSDCFKLPWCTARLITNRHFLKHGLPVSAISHAHSVDIRYYTYFHEAWDARVTSGGELMLRCVRTWSSYRAICLDTKLLGRQHMLEVCAHMKTDCRRDHFGCRLFDIGSVEYKPHRICYQCGVECDIRIGLGTGNVEVEGRYQDRINPTWTVSITTYCNLGTCRSVDDPKWAVFSAGRVLDQRAPPYGTLKTLWEDSGASSES